MRNSRLKEVIAETEAYLEELPIGYAVGLALSTYKK